MTFYKWSTTAATNSSADATINWAEGQAPSTVNDSARGMMAAAAKFRNDISGTITTGGTSTAYTVTTNQVFTTAALMSGALICFIPHTDSGAAATLAVDGLTARAINVSTGVAIPTGALKTGTPYLVTYIHASTEFIMVGALDKSLLTAVDIVGGTSLTAPDVLDSMAVYDVSVTANRKVLLSDFYKTINGLTADATPVASTDYIVTYDASATAAKKVLIQNIPSALPRGYIDGCIVSNGTDATNDINVAAGVCRDSTNAVNITVAAMAGKQLDANWAPGAAAGMRNSAAGIANSWYHIYAVSKADGTQDIYAYAGVDGTDPESSATIAAVITALQAESGGADYLYARRIRSIERRAAAILATTQMGDQVLWTSPILDLAGNINIAPSLNPLSVPPGLKIVPIINAIIDTGSVTIYLSSPDQSDSAPGASTFWTLLANAQYNGAGAVSLLRTDTNRQIRARSSANGTPIRILMIGYFDNRGKDL
jgi:hypothetical protein